MYMYEDICSRDPIALCLTALIQLGSGEMAYQDEFLQALHEGGRDVKYVAFSTGWLADGLWEVEDISGAL